MSYSSLSIFLSFIFSLFEIEIRAFVCDIFHLLRIKSHHPAAFNADIYD